MCRTTHAKDLLTRYGGAYLATSISLSLVSFGLCYVLVNNRVDVTALLEKVLTKKEDLEKVYIIRSKSFLCPSQARFLSDCKLVLFSLFESPSEFVLYSLSASRSVGLVGISFFLSREVHARGWRVFCQVGIYLNETGDNVGTFALAYAAHKAASPIRFPPTVALTPIVAGWFGKKPADVVEEALGVSEFSPSLHVLVMASLSAGG